MGNTPNLAPNTKKNHQYKQLYYSAAKAVTKCTNTKAKPSTWKVMKLCENQLLKYCTM